MQKVVKKSKPVAKKETKKETKITKNVKSEKSAAILTIFDVAKMTPAGRKNIAKWLIQQAEFVLMDGKYFTSRYTGRYIYKSK